MGMEQLTSDSLRTVILFLIGIASVLVSLQKGIEAYHSLFRKKTEDRERKQDERLTALETNVGDLKARLDKGDKQFEKLRDDIKELLDIQNVVLMHMITGNSTDKLKQTKEQLDTYMTKR